MPGWMKVIVGVFVVLLILGGIGAFFAVRWLRGGAASLKEAAQAVDREARTFAEGKDAEACIAESFARIARCDGGILCQAKTRAFLTRCLDVVPPSPELCAQVPTGAIAAGRWGAEECARRGKAGDQGCIQIMGAVAMHCRPASDGATADPS